MTTKHASYDVIIIGGAIMGSAAAWWLSKDPAFSGRVLVVERDPTYEFASTSHTNSCIRQQFGTEINVLISQFGVEFIQNFAEWMRRDDAPLITLQSFGYLYLSDTAEFTSALVANAELQNRLGAGTQAPCKRFHIFFLKL